MKITQITVEVKKCKNYQTYGCSETIILDSGDDVEAERRKAQARCRKAVMEQMELM